MKRFLTAFLLVSFFTNAMPLTLYAKQNLIFLTKHAVNACFYLNSYKNFNITI